MRQLWFQTSHFAPQAGEEEKTNPGRFGEALARWLRERLVEAGYGIEEEPLAEDWGWVVMVQRRPLMLWVGCGNEDGSTHRWSLFVAAERGPLQRLFSRADPAPSVAALEQALERIVRAAGFEAVAWESD